MLLVPDHGWGDGLGRSWKLLDPMVQIDKFPGAAKPLVGGLGSRAWPGSAAWGQPHPSSGAQGQCQGRP